MINVWFKVIDGLIVDAIDYEYEGYVQAQIASEHLPHDIYSGVYIWNGTEYVFDQDLYDAAHVGE
jgi:hypothetical protein